jgi:hypothetical protein
LVLEAQEESTLQTLLTEPMVPILYLPQSHQLAAVVVDQVELTLAELDLLEVRVVEPEAL